MMNSDTFRNRARTAFKRRNWSALHQLLPSMPTECTDDAEVHYMVGTACLELQDLTHAVHHLAQAQELEPDSARCAIQLALALSTAQQASPAQQIATRAISLGPESADDWDRLGVVFTRCLAYEQACDAFRRALELRPESAAQHYNLATVLKSLGRVEEAEAMLTRCLQLDPCHWPAHYSLAHLGRAHQSVAHIRQLQAVLPRACGNPGAEMPARVALSREYEQLGYFDRAFEQLVAGKRIGKKAIGYNFSQDREIYDAIESARSPATQECAGHESAEPIFVVGMPRTGTTLIERILSSHSNVSQTGELLNFGMAMKRLSGSRSSAFLDPSVIAGLERADWAALGKLYVDSTRPTTGITAHFIDKMPQNFLNLGYIARALPKAAIICLHRNPMDTCLGNFRELFTLGTPYWNYTFDILDIGRYYLRFRRLMAHWASAFPGRILGVRYEDLVNDQESTIRALLQHCSLEWEDGCLRFEHNPLPVSSASATQVRSGINRRSMGRWKQYREQLGELETLLREGGVLAD